mgnify:FL=1
MSSEAEIRKRKIYRVTFVGFVVNLVLSVLKLAAGIVGRSGAMVADAVHSFSDLATDVVVIAFARISAKPRDDGHDYGHGKYETLATIIISLALGIVGAGILAGSIRDNVYFGESEAPADDEGLAQAVELSQAKEFVDKLPDGTQHHVAQMGRNMSGGQKQRLSIARALARKPEILVFDDSFSALDYRTDAKLREGLSKQLHDTTKIIVAQRISTIRHADKIIVLDRGEAVGIGTHEELMRNCDVYREIATSQLSAAELA